MEDRLIGPQEVANYLGVPVATVRRWSSLGTGPRSYKVGRHRRYRMSEIDQWLDSLGQPKDPEAP